MPGDFIKILNEAISNILFDDEKDILRKHNGSNTEDLIIKGYNGSIPYERDFAREAEEFLPKISVI